MRTILMTLTLLVSFSVQAATVVQKTSKKTTQKSFVAKTTVRKQMKAPQVREKGEYQTNMAFDGTSLNGRLAEGSLRKIVVENDKSLDDLLGVRKKFDDREQEESQRNASW